MLFRIKNSFGPALLLALFASIPVFAKGGFSFITVTGPGIKEPLRITDPDLTTDFFAFANFYEDRIEAPTSPGESFEITRYYLDGNNEIAFDQLHYHPETGLVFYDGILNGESEYDGKWYKANPDITSTFEAAIFAPSGPESVSENLQPAQAVAQVTTPASQGQIMAVVLMAGLALILVYRVRKPTTR